MFKKIVGLMLVLLVQVVSIYAGIMWKSDNKVSSVGKAEELSKFQCYAQDGNVRQEAIKGSFSSFLKEGTYMLYKKDNKSIYLINTKDKTYSELPFDMLMGMAASMMKIEVGGVKVSKLAPEVISGYKCNHVKIASNYSMKSQFMNMQIKIDQIQEIWGTMDLPTKDLSDLFLLQSFRSGWKELDELIDKEISAMKDIGFPIKSITVMKQTTGIKEGSETKTIESISYDINTKKIDDGLFDIPQGYKKIELFSPNMMKNK